MADRDTMMNPPIEDLLDKVDSKFTLVSAWPPSGAGRSTRTSTSWARAWAPSSRPR